MLNGKLFSATYEGGVKVTKFPSCQGVFWLPLKRDTGPSGCLARLLLLMNYLSSEGRGFKSYFFLLQGEFWGPLRGDTAGLQGASPSFAHTHELFLHLSFISAWSFFPCRGYPCCPWRGTPGPQGASPPSAHTHQLFHHLSFTRTWIDKDKHWFTCYRNNSII